MFYLANADWIMLMVRWVYQTVTAHLQTQKQRNICLASDHEAMVNRWQRRASHSTFDSGFRSDVRLRGVSLPTISELDWELTHLVDHAGHDRQVTDLFWNATVSGSAMIPYVLDCRESMASASYGFLSSSNLQLPTFTLSKILSTIGNKSTN